VSAENYILVVDDDKNICELLRLYLEKEGYRVIAAYDGNTAYEYFLRTNFDLLILDIMMPGIDGIELLKKIRRESDVPVIMLTAKGETIDKVIGLEIGADDYMVKPFEAKELIARIKAIFRRVEKRDTDSSRPICFDNLSIDMSTYELIVCGKKLEIPPKELELLSFLCSHPNKVFTRDQLLNEVWGYDYYGESRTIDVHVKRLREKIDGASDKWELKTVWRVGYKFEVK